jgi:uncharacterized protein (TIGR02118 family)
MMKLSVLYGHPKSPQDFERYYWDTHTPIARKVKNVRRFETAMVAATADGSPSPFYRLADLYFDDMASLQAALASPEGQAAAQDLPNFATGGATLLIAEVQDLLAK